MSILSRLQKYALSSIGALSGFAFVYYALDTEKVNNKSQSSIVVNNSFSKNYTPVNWDHNWDRRDPKSLVKPPKLKTPEDENEYNRKCEAKKSRAVRHLILIRHGQYNLYGNTDEEKILTKLGRKQAELTGKRLAELGLPYSLIVRSTMKRAQETSFLIEQSLPNVKAENDSILVEGYPIPPEPPLSSWRPEVSLFQDGPRIESAFRKYFHRAHENQINDSYTIIVCHANVIRYFVCRALQFPPEAWLRISLKHASITWLAIGPTGKVSLKCLGDAGHLPQELLTTKMEP